MELNRCFQGLLTTSLIALVLCVDSGVFGAPLTQQVTLDPVSSPILHSQDGFRLPKIHIFCDTCNWIVKRIQSSMQKNASENAIAKLIEEICDIFNIEDHYVCDTIVAEFKDEVFYIFAHSALQPSEICGAVLGSNCGNKYNPFNQKWTIPIPGNKPPVKHIIQPKSGSPDNRILQLSDIHWDAQYTPGLTKECGEPLCCRPPNKKATNPEDAAGIWGALHCDTPYRTVINLMKHLNKISDQFDWVYVTGDLPAHNDWSQTRDDQIEVLVNMTTVIKTYLPGKQIYFSIGNHESAPVNSFPPPFVTGKESISWLLNKSAEMWGEWLTDDAIKTLKKAGYYSVNVKPDLRVISLQTNFCYKLNWWLLINSTDPGDMLKWLIDELLDAEKNGEKVHIIGHVSPGSKDCLDTWSKMYHDILFRFESTIVGQFFGHAHSDSFKVFYADEDSNSERPIGVIYLSPSVTPYGGSGMNLGYRMYDIDGTYNGSTRITLDHSTYILNITEANLTNKPKWMLEYSAKDAYNMTSLLPVDWANLVEKFIKDDSLFQKYYHYYFKNISPNDQCTKGCRCATLNDLTFNKTIDCQQATQDEIFAYMSTQHYC